MDGAARTREQQQEDREPLALASAVYQGRTPDAARARDLARDFLATAQAEHGVRVSVRARDVVQLVVSELVTNAFKYAPGPCLLGLALAETSVSRSPSGTAPRSCR